MTVSPSSTDLERMSPTDIRNANIIALLLLCAKTLQVVTPLCGANANVANRDVAGKHLAEFVYQLTSMYGDGHGLETGTLALAKELGFNVEQQYLSKVAHA
jgi:hypothetical protein